MLTCTEIEHKLYEQAALFKVYMLNKKFAQAKSCYQNALTVALFVGLPEKKIAELFGDRQQDPPVEGLFREDLVQEAFYEVAVKRRGELRDIEKEIAERRTE